MIIHDFLDNDLYKFTAMNAIQKKFPDSEVVYRFVNRGNTSFPPGFEMCIRDSQYIVTGDQFATMMNIKGIPHFLLYSLSLIHI